MHLQFSRKHTFNIKSISITTIILIIFFCCNSINLFSQFDNFKNIIKEVDKGLNKSLLNITSITDEEENEIGLETQKQILLDYKVGRTNKFNISEIFRNIKSKVSRTKIKYEFKILESSDFNAFAIAGGKTFIFTKLLQELDNQDEIAFVIAHEIAHNELKHCIERIQYSIKASKINPFFADIVQLSYNIYSTPFSQDKEFAADDLGIKLMMKAGYNKEGAISFFNKLENIEKKYGLQQRDAFNDFISSHPTAHKRKERIKNIK